MGADESIARFVAGKYRDAIANKGGFTLSVFREVVKDISLQFCKHDGHFYVLLSLEEAEHFRGYMHSRTEQTFLSSEASAAQPTTSALYFLSDFDLLPLEMSRAFQPGNKSQTTAMVNSYRFLNSDTYFTVPAVSAMIRVLESDSCEAREKWWYDIRACRRRRQIAIDGSFPLFTIFRTRSDFEHLEFKSTVHRLQAGLNEKGLLVFDAFRVFNSSNSGLMTCSELYGGLDFLHIPFTPPQVYDFVKRVAVKHEGLICYEDFKRVLQLSEDELESHTAGGAGESNFEAVPPHKIPELVDLNKVCTPV